MPHHAHIKVEGRIGDVFFHRFVIETVGGEKILADIGPKGVEAFPLKSGAEVAVEGEMKPSELKVERIAIKGAAAVTIHHKKPGHHDPHHHGPHHHEPADPQIAVRAVATAGFEPIGAPRRKPKHFEVLARKGRRLVECHVELDGHIRKEKPVAPHDHKWAEELMTAA